MNKNTFEFFVDIDMDKLSSHITDTLSDDAKYRLLCDIAYGIENIETLEKFKIKLNYITKELFQKL